MAATELFIFAASALLSAKAQDEAQGEARKARNQRQRIADIKAKRERTELIRQSRIARAQQIAGGVATGVTGSSGQTGALASISSQTAANVSFLDTTQSLGKQANIFEGKSIAASGRANLYSSIGDVAYKFKDV